MAQSFFNGSQSWREKTLDADKIWEQVSQALEQHGYSLPQVSRRPDVRVILDNVSGVDQMFRNPGDHSNKAETIPANGEKTAAMVMLQGETLDEQYQNACKLVERYHLKEEGLSLAFVQALNSGEALDLVAEAYGPAPFEEQVDRLENVHWEKADGSTSNVDLVKDGFCAYGARAAMLESAFLCDFKISVHGTGTVPELMDGGSIAVAVSEDWQTGKETTRPIVPEVAKTFYGASYSQMPRVDVHPDGYVQKIDLGNGDIIDYRCDESMAIKAKPAP